MRIIFIGMKACGKTTVGRLLAKKLNIDLIELDQKIENEHWGKKKEKLTSRQIFKKYGRAYFRSLENNILKRIAKTARDKNFVLDCGGGTPLMEENQKVLSSLGKIVFLDTDKKVILKRILKRGVPAFFPKNQDPEKSFAELLRERIPTYTKLADFTVRIKKETPQEIIDKIMKNLMCLHSIHQVCAGIDGETKIVGFFGSTYRLSKMYTVYNAAFAALGLNYIYVPFVITDLKNAVCGIRHLGIKAIGVTIPYKIKIIPFLDKLDNDAKRIGAVNVVVNDNGILVGGNTDGKGAVKALKEKTTIAGKKVVLLGAGGAARAIAFSIKDNDGEIVILNRTRDPAKNLAEAVGAKYNDLTAIEDELRDADILINTTPVGMIPNINNSLVSKNYLRPNLTVQELITKPTETKLIRDAKGKRCKIVTGDRMLLWQSVLKFNYYTGEEAPKEVMEEALRNV